MDISDDIFGDHKPVKASKQKRTKLTGEEKADVKTLSHTNPVKAVAEETGLSEQTVYRIKRGELIPSDPLERDKFIDRLQSNAVSVNLDINKKIKKLMKKKHFLSVKEIATLDPKEQVRVLSIMVKTWKELTPTRTAKPKDMDVGPIVVIGSDIQQKGLEEYKTIEVRSQEDD